MKPKPLNLERFGKGERKMSEAKPLDLEEIEIIILAEQLGALTFERMMQKIKQLIKSACKFYLKYKDKPRLLIKEIPKIKKLEYDGIKIEDMFLNNNWGTIVWNNLYNEWLFKLAFKDALEEGERK